MTGAGTIMGTFQYMAPEQLEGKEADARTDLFAFGAVVYEMATGRKAFEGESQASLITAIMSSEPEPISTLQPMTPPALDHIVNRCLTKDSDDRFDTAHDVMLELQWIAEGGPQTAASEPVVTLRRYRSHLLWGIMAAVLIGAVIGWFSNWNLKPRSSEVQRQVTRFTVEPPEHAPLSIEYFYPDVAISPDEAHIAYVARNKPTEMQLFLRRVDQLEAIPIRGTEGKFVYSPFFAPDGSQIGFFDGRRLKKVSIRGGVPVTLWHFEDFGGASWDKDDTIIVGSINAGLFRLSAAGGKPEVLTTLDADRGERLHVLPHVLPGGKGVLFTIVTSESQLAVLDPKTREYRVLFPGVRPQHSSTGHIIYGREEALYAVGFDSRKLVVTGEPVPILENVTTKLSGTVNFSLSDRGSLVYVPNSPGERELVWVNRNGVAEPLAQDSSSFRNPRFAPDVQSLAVVIDNVSWFLDLRRNILEKVGHESLSIVLLSPDGAQAVVHSGDAMAMNLFLISMNSDSVREQLTFGKFTQIATSWSPDGKFLVYVGMSAETRGDIWLLPMEGDREPRLFRGTEFAETQAPVSPHGAWIAFRSDHSGRNEIYVEPFPHGGPIIQISSQGGTEPVWSKDGRELFYRNREEMMVVAIKTEPEFEPGKPRLLFRGSYELTPYNIPNYDVAPDGRFLMIRKSENSSSSQINVVLNWSEELKRLVPTEN